jgi:hypothetical protein
MLREIAVAVTLCAACASWAQQTPDFAFGTMGKPNEESDWKESEVPPPPALRTSGLVAVEVSASAELRYGVDPESIAVGKDRVVRYVIVASSRSGAINALYEGLRCDRGEYRVYARSSGQGWRPAETEWKSIFEGAEARQALAIAKGGACVGRTPNGGAERIARDLGTREDRKFGGSSAP